MLPDATLSGEGFDDMMTVYKFQTDRQRRMFPFLFQKNKNKQRTSAGSISLSWLMLGQKYTSVCIGANHCLALMSRLVQPGEAGWYGRKAKHFPNERALYFQYDECQVNEATSEEIDIDVDDGKFI